MLVCFKITDCINGTHEPSTSDSVVSGFISLNEIINVFLHVENIKNWKYGN